MRLDIIYRTHDGGDRIANPNCPVIPRKVDATKKEITLTCSRSLSRSYHLCEKDVHVTILDDNSCKDTIDELESLFGTRVTPLEGNFEDGLLTYFTRARDSKADLVYLIEDDFLHRPEAISELIETYYNFLQNVTPEAICLYPDDDYWNHTPPHGPIETMVVPGVARPWRMHNYTTGTMFTNPTVLKEHWDQFEFFTTNFLTDPSVTEATTISLIWKMYVPLFTPLIPLAYHLDHHPSNVLYHRKSIDELWAQNT